MSNNRVNKLLPLNMSFIEIWLNSLKLSLIYKFVAVFNNRKTCINWLLKIDKTKILMTNDNLMKVNFYRMLPLEYSAILMTCMKQNWP